MEANIKNNKSRSGSEWQDRKRLFVETWMLLLPLLRKFKGPFSSSKRLLSFRKARFISIFIRHETLKKNVYPAWVFWPSTDRILGITCLPRWYLLTVTLVKVFLQDMLRCFLGRYLFFSSHFSLAYSFSPSCPRLS